MDLSEIKKLKKFSNSADYEITDKRKEKLLGYVGKRLITTKRGLGIVDSIQYDHKRRNTGTTFIPKWEAVRCVSTITYLMTDDMGEVVKVYFSAWCGNDTVMTMVNDVKTYKRYHRQVDIFEEYLKNKEDVTEDNNNK